MAPKRNWDFYHQNDLPKHWDVIYLNEFIPNLIYLKMGMSTEKYWILGRPIIKQTHVLAVLSLPSLTTIYNNIIPGMTSTSPYMAISPIFQAHHALEWFPGIAQHCVCVGGWGLP